jgi:hypothetical protein
MWTMDRFALTLEAINKFVADSMFAMLVYEELLKVKEPWFELDEKTNGVNEIKGRLTTREQESVVTLACKYYDGNPVVYHRCTHWTGEDKDTGKITASTRGPSAGCFGPDYYAEQIMQNLKWEYEAMRKSENG